MRENLPDMVWILQRYIFRELGRTFLLCAAGLTLLLGLSGGVVNMIKVGELEAGQAASLMLVVLPIAFALTLPIAAMYSAAATYGRFSAANEFMACRSSGINILVLFAPAVVLSLLTGVLSFASINFMIPGLVGNLNRLVGADMASLIQQRLQRPRGLALGGRWRLYADRSWSISQQHNHIHLQHIAFLELDGGQWSRVGTAREVDLVLEQRDDELAVGAAMRGMSYYDRRTNTISEGSFELPQNVFPSQIFSQIRFLNLFELLELWRKPYGWREVRTSLADLRDVAARKHVLDALWNDLRTQGSLVLEDGGVRYVVRAGRMAVLPEQGGLELWEVRAQETRGESVKSYEATRAVLELPRQGLREDGSLWLKLYDEPSPPAGQGSSRSGLLRTTLGPLPIPAQIQAQADNIDALEIAHAEQAGSDDELSKARAMFHQTVGQTILKARGVFHERMAFSISALVLVVLAAALGIIRSNAHAMTAFGISFVPSAFVLVTIVAGRQLATGGSMPYGGLVMLWSGVAIVAGLNLWILTRVVRR